MAGLLENLLLISTFHPKNGTQDPSPRFVFRLRGYKIVVQKKVNDVAMDDSLIIGHDTGNICLDDDTFEEIFCQPKGIGLGGFFVFSDHLPCGLNIHMTLSGRRLQAGFELTVQ